MSGDIQPRSGTKLRQQRKKSKNSGMLMPELDISGIKSRQQDKVLGNGSSNSDVKNVCWDRETQKPWAFFDETQKKSFASNNQWTMAKEGKIKYLLLRTTESYVE